MGEPINGIWGQWTSDTYHQSSPKLAAFLASYLDVSKPVTDFGCGNAYYIAELAKQGFDCMGIEGYLLNNFLHNNVLIHDLTQPLHFARQGAVICLEVLEHIPAEYEQTVLDNITRHCDGDLIFSWALKGQPGIGHVNTVDQEYAIEQIVKRGFNYFDAATEVARQNVDDNTSWFRNTLLIFSRK